MKIDNIILKVRVGSHLYGTNTEDSDEDFVGIFIPDEEYLLGLNRVEEVDQSTVDKDESGRNTKEAIDCKFYTLEKFCRLTLDNNPNMIERLFVNEENIIEINDIGEELLSLKQYFLSQNIKHRFLGYAFSQKSKMVMKLENYTKIDEAISFLEESKLDYINEIEHHPLFIRKKKEIIIGDVVVPANLTIKKVIKMLSARRDKFSGHRRELVDQYGYDTKFASHLIRLLSEGIELLSINSLTFPLRGRDLILSIKKGKYTLNQIIAIAERFEHEVELWYNHTTLPKTPYFHKINNFVINTHKKYIRI